MSGQDDQQRACARRRFLPDFARVCLSLAMIQPFSTACNAQVVERFKLIGLGFAVAIDGNTTISGVPNDEMENGRGSAFLFNATTGQELFKLSVQSEGLGNFLGSSVGISGNIAIAGAPADERDGVESGSAHLFDVSTGQELFKLTASDAASGDQFGTSVAISGNVAIVGARKDDDGGRDSGSAYLFDAATGQQLFKLTASDAAANDSFGESVGISGNVAIVGAPSFRPGEFGSAYLFDVTTGQQLFKLMASDATERDGFGFSVSIDGNSAIIGGSAAYLFDVATGQERLKLAASDAAHGDHFGESVAISSGKAIVGADQDDDAGMSSGSAYLFDVATGRELAKLVASDAAPGLGFGSSVSISGNTAVVGSSGAAYVFSVPEPSSLVLGTLALMVLLGYAVRR